MKFFYLIGLSLFCLSSLSAQKDIEGLWEGTITIGGIHSNDSYKFQLYLKSSGRKITGKSIVHLGNEEYIEMDVWGTWHGDRSVYMEEFKFIPVIGKEEEGQKAPFYRKYQFIHNRSIWESKLEGYWQEITNDTFGQKRKRGRITLKRIDKKNKA